MKKYNNDNVKTIPHTKQPPSRPLIHILRQKPEYGNPLPIYSELDAVAVPETPLNAYSKKPTNPMPIHQPCCHSRHGAQQLRLKDEFAFLVFLAGLVRLIVLPTHRLLTLSAMYVAYYVATGRHVALVRLRLGDVDDLVKEVCFAVLAAEILERTCQQRRCRRKGKWRTLLRMSSWLERCVLHVLQP